MTGTTQAQAGSEAATHSTPRTTPEHELTTSDDRSGDFSVDPTVEEVAKMFGRSESTVRSWCARGIIEGAYKFLHREWRIPVEALRQFQDAQRSDGLNRAQAEPIPFDLGSWRKNETIDA
jgi:hypothetical protein